MQNKDSLFVIFGLPGRGKSYIGKIFKKYYGFYFYEGDKNLSRTMRESFTKKIILNDQERDAFFKRLLGSIKKLKSRYTKIAVAQTFIKEKYRSLLLEEFPHAQFILIDSSDELRDKRLAKRKIMQLDLEYVRRMCMNFEKPQIPHISITNNEQGSKALIKQLSSFL